MTAGNDNFTVLRLLAATLVIYGHCWALGNRDGWNEWLTRYWLVFSGTVAVNVFFFVSGFLVTMSYARRHSLRSFARARLLRIYPALTACVCFCGLVLGTGVTTLPAPAYLSTPRLYAFLAHNASLLSIQSDLPGVFKGNRYADVVNGSLWTLPGELQMYGYVAALGVLGLLRTKRRFVLALAALVLLATAGRSHVPMVSLPEFYGFAAFFAGGAACWMFREHVPVSGGLLLLLIIGCVLTYSGTMYWPVFAATTAYAALWFVYVPRLPLLHNLGDYSYGLYLYGFPMQQLVAWRFPGLEPWPLLFVSFPLAFALAVGSWHWIEKPALAFK